MQTSEIRATVHDIWAAVLGSPDIDDELGFFDCGGDSILLIALHTKLSEAYPQVTIKLVDLLRSSTVVEQTEALKVKLEASAG
jgi:glutamate racemase